MKHKILTFGIIGYGAFGELVAGIIAKYIPVSVASRRRIPSADLPENVSVKSFEEVARCDVVILCNELAALEANCQRLAPLVKPKTIVIDVCSVKLLPVQIMEHVLGKKCRVLATHPLFGNQSVQNYEVKGKKIVWHEVAGGPFNELESFVTDRLGLKIIKMSPEEHDKQMAWVHSLTFFVGRGLLELNPPKSALATNYYERLLDVMDIEKTHSYELFRTIQLGNMYSPKVRKEFLQTLQSLDAQLQKDHL